MNNGKRGAKTWVVVAAAGAVMLLAMCRGPGQGFLADALSDAGAALRDTGNDAWAQDGAGPSARCVSWSVQMWRPNDVHSFDVPDGYEPINAQGDTNGLIEIFARKCLEWE